jgi:hypothetical protein
MNKKEKIRVIKKDAVKTTAAPEPVPEETEKDATSKLSSTVSGWIAESQQRRREEKETAMERFGS